MPWARCHSMFALGSEAGCPSHAKTTDSPAINQWLQPILFSNILEYTIHTSTTFFKNTRDWKIAYSETLYLAGHSSRLRLIARWSAPWGDRDKAVVDALLATHSLRLHSRSQWSSPPHIHTSPRVQNQLERSPTCLSTKILEYNYEFYNWYEYLYRIWELVLIYLFTIVEKLITYINWSLFS